MHPIERELNEALAYSRRGADLDDVARRVWAAYAAGAIGEAEAQRLHEQVEERRIGSRKAREGQRAASAPLRSIFPTRRVQRAPRRPEALARRRRVAAMGALPPALAARFTTGEQAVLAVVAGEARCAGACQFPLDKIAALAGVSRSTAKNAIRAAAAHGLIAVEIRPRKGQKNLPNKITIACKDWQAWLERGPRDRGQKDHPHEYQNKKNREKRAFRDGATGRSEPHRHPARSRWRPPEEGNTAFSKRGKAQ